MAFRFRFRYVFMNFGAYGFRLYYVYVCPCNFNFPMDNFLAELAYVCTAELRVKFLHGRAFLPNYFAANISACFFAFCSARFAACLALRSSRISSTVLICDLLNISHIVRSNCLRKVFSLIGNHA